MLFVLQLLSKVSVDKVFMHYVENMLSASGGFAPVPHRGSASGQPGNVYAPYKLVLLVSLFFFLSNDLSQQDGGTDITGGRPQKSIVRKRLVTLRLIGAIQITVSIYLSRYWSTTGHQPCSV